MDICKIIAQESLFKNKFRPEPGSYFLAGRYFLSREVIFFHGSIKKSSGLSPEVIFLAGRFFLSREVIFFTGR